MDIYWPSFYWAMFTLMLAWLASISGCQGLSESECAAVNGVCSDGGCF